MLRRGSLLATPMRNGGPNVFSPPLVLPFCLFLDFLSCSRSSYYIPHRRTAELLDDLPLSLSLRVSVSLVVRPRYGRQVPSCYLCCAHRSFGGWAHDARRSMRFPSECRKRWLRMRVSDLGTVYDDGGRRVPRGRRFKR